MSSAKTSVGLLRAPGASSHGESVPDTEGEGGLVLMKPCPQRGEDLARKQPASGRGALLSTDPEAMRLLGAPVNGGGHLLRSSFAPAQP